MTPPAKALDMPTRENMKHNALATETGRAPALRDHKGTFPTHITPGGGWLSSLAHEQIHSLATHVIAHHTEHGLRTMAVTSALAGEGKTTLTLALADKLSRAEKRVLVVDLDTHRATLSSEAKLEGVEGALESSAAGGGTDLPLHAYPTNLPNVFIMPVGKVDLSHMGGVPLLDPARVQALVQRALEEFDIVLLDCPPLLPVADTHVIAEVADRALLVVRANSTPKQIVEQAVKEFDRQKLFAAILNRAQPQFIPYFREVYGYYRRPAAK
jgi:Mrp family chromosome partitioning ATPase